EVDIVALTSEAPIRKDLDLDERVARRAGARTGRALSLKTQDLAVDEPWRNFHVERAAVGKGQPPHRSCDGVDELDRHAIVQISTAPIGPGALTASQQLAELVVSVHVVGEPRTVGVEMSAVGRGKVAVILLRRTFRARRVDLALVEAPALVRVGEKIVG